MASQTPRQFGDVESCVERTLSDVGNNIVLCAPIALGKPVALVNEFYRRAAGDPGIRLTLLTGLSLRRPGWRSELERRLVEPLAARVFGGGPDPAWVGPLLASRLPANVSVHEFYVEPGAYLHSAQAQQSYASINYTEVAAAVAARGANVLAQQVARRRGKDGDSYSLGANPDVTMDLLPLLAARRRSGQPVAVLAQVNDQMPFMFGDALLPDSAFDGIVDDPAGYHPLFAPPNLPISPADHLIAMYASMLVRDGGTLQIGIGEMGDAVVYALLLRHQRNRVWRKVCRDLGAAGRFPGACEAIGGDSPFARGLYGNSEMFVDGFLDLYRAGILKRRVYPDAGLQRRVDGGAPAPPGGALLHGAFLLGPQAFYESLRKMDDDERALFQMVPVSFTNQLAGPDWELRVAQRRHARFINTAMIATLLGAAASDGLEDGRIVSGVGGQYNFVAQAHELPEARSVLAVRATRESAGKVTSNIRFSYGHATIPRHLRDIYLTEYGIADVRGRSDAEVIAAMLNIADSRFQPGLLAEAQRAGKLPRDHRIPDIHRNNLPLALEATLAPHRAAGLFGELPFGGDLTDEEVALARALRRIKAATGSMAGRLRLLGDLLRPRPRDKSLRPYLARMQLEAPASLQERIWQRLVARSLRATRQNQ